MEELRTRVGKMKTESFKGGQASNVEWKK